MVEVWFLGNCFANSHAVSLGFISITAYRISTLTVQIEKNLWQNSFSIETGETIVGISGHLKFNFHRQNEMFLPRPSLRNLLEFIRHTLPDINLFLKERIDAQFANWYLVIFKEIKNIRRWKLVLSKSKYWTKYLQIYHIKIETGLSF